MANRDTTHNGAHSYDATPRSLFGRGFSLLETILFIVFFTLSLFAITQVVLILTRSYSALRSSARIVADATLSMERMAREIRDAASITDAGSTFNTNPGTLLLSTTDASGNARSIEFSVINSQLSLKENGVLTGALSGKDTAVTNLIFRKATTTRSQGVKIELALRSGVGLASTTKKFYMTALLRDSY